MNNTIKYNYIDYYCKFDINKDDFIKKVLEDNHLQGELSDRPDYLVLFPYFQNHYLNYDCVRISCTEENVTPDFNLVDYAIGFDYMEYADRYYRYPLWMDYKTDLELAKVKHLEIPENFADRKFCNFLYSNADGAKEREMFFNLLSGYRSVDSGGKFLNNINERVENKLEFQEGYNFSIAFENASSPGYTTEKILQAFAAKTIPIYWGDPMIGNEFNEKAFINCHKYGSFEEVVEVVREIDQNEELMLKYLKEPTFTEKQLENIDKLARGLEQFLLHIFEQPYESAFRRNRGYWGKLYEEEQRFLLLEMRKNNVTWRSLKFVLYALMRKRYHGMKKTLKKIQKVLREKRVTMQYCDKK